METNESEPELTEKEEIVELTLQTIRRQLMERRKKQVDKLPPIECDIIDI